MKNFKLNKSKDYGLSLKPSKLFGFLLFSLLAFSELSFSAGVNITICNIEQNSRGTDWTLDGTQAVNLRSKLLNAGNFSQTGTDVTTFTIVDSFGTPGSITAASLNNAGCEVFFKGYVADADITNAEANALVDWVTNNGGTLLEFAENNNFNLVATTFGYDTTNSNATSWTATPVGVTHPMFNGVFGTATQINTVGQKAYFNNSTNADIIATDDIDNEPTILDKSLGNGHAVFLGDVDVVLRAVSAGNGNNTDQDHFALNLFAYAAFTFNENNYTPAAPLITSPADGSTSNDNTTTVSGTADPGVTITVTGPNGETCSVVADINGDWSCEIAPALADGSNLLTANATFGSNTSGDDTVNVTIDTSAPAAPVVTSPVDGELTDDNTPVVTGTAEPGSTVVVTGPNGETCSAVADINGDWSCEIAPALADGSNVLNVTATDPAGNTSPPTMVTVNVDTAAPIAPVITTPTNGAPVTGTGEPGATVTVTTPSGATCMALVQADGTWSCTLVPAPVDGEDITADQTDPAGNTSPPVTVPGGVDTSAPAAPVCTVTPDPANNGTPLSATCTGVETGAVVTIPGYVCGVESGNVVVCNATAGQNGVDGDETATVEDAAGNTATAPADFTLDNGAPIAPVINTPTNGAPVTGTGEPGATVTVTTPSGATCMALVQADGTWSCTLVPAAVDGEDITADQTDPAGNTSPPVTVPGGIDTTAPTAPVIDPINENTDPITGTAEPGTIINITGLVCDNEPVITDAAGNWFCDVTNSAPLTPGDVIGATATDEAGNESLPASGTVGNSATQSVSPTVNPVPAGATEITGTAVPGSIIDLTGITCSNAPVTADSSGNWVCESPAPVPAADDIISATATQDGLLPSAPVSTTVFDPSVTAPPAPQVDPTDGDPVTGTTIPNGEIMVLDINGNVLCTTTADAAGNYSCSPVIPAPVDGDVLGVIVTDDNGNSSLPTQVIVDTTAPTAPVVTSPVDGELTNDNTPVVTGTAEPGSTVIVTGPNGETCTATADINGDWSCEIAPALADGSNVLDVTATDPAGNTSPPTMVTVNVDTAAPIAPVITTPTNGAPVTGTGEPGATVTVTTPSGSICMALVQPDGTWSCTLDPAPEDGEDVTADQTDPAGNTSPPVTVPGGIDTTAPAAPVCTVTPDPANDGTVVTATCTGVETGATITIPGYVCAAEAGNEVICTATVGVDGVDGDETATIEDAAGNTADAPAEFELDNDAPAAPSINDPSSGLTVSGNGEPGATVTVTTPSGASCMALVQADGSWSCDLSPEPVDGETATASQTDPAGNESPDATATVVYAPDLTSFITNCVAGVLPNEAMLYEVNIMNTGNIDILGAQVTTVLGELMSNPSWICQATGGANCDNTAGNGDLNELVDLPVGSGLVYMFDTTVTGDLLDFIDVETMVTMPAGTTDVNSDDNITFDSDLIYQFIFKDSFDCAAPGTVGSTNQLLESLLN